MSIQILIFSLFVTQSNCWTFQPQNRLQWMNEREANALKSFNEHSFIRHIRDEEMEEENRYVFRMNRET